MLCGESMAGAQDILSVLLSISACLLIWFLLRIRQKRRHKTIVESEDYSNNARNPNSLKEPDAKALAELDKLLNERFHSEE